MTPAPTSSALINNPSTLTSSVYFTPKHQEALELEVYLLQTLWRRHCGHQGRTQAFQRLRMAIRPCSQWCMDVYEQLKVIQDDLHNTRERLERQRQRETIFWQVATTTATATQHSTTTELQTRARSIAVLVFHRISEVRSRLRYAAEALWLDLTRGFFGPLYSVATACIARIHALLGRLAQYGLERMSTWETAWKLLPAKSQLWEPLEFQTNQAQLLQELATEPPSSPNQRGAIMQTLGFPPRKEFLEPKNNVQPTYSKQPSIHSTGNNDDLDKLEKDNSMITADDSSVEEDEAATPHDTNDDTIDIGVSVSHTAREEGIESIEKYNDGMSSLDQSQLNNDAFKSVSKVDQSSMHTSLDQNMMLLVQHQAKKNEKTKEKKRKPSESSTKTRAKRKRKKGKSDFFDSLFDK
jgi:hypothetical protein